MSVLRNPISDLTGNLLTHQHCKCADLEINFVRCMENYGIPRGFRECHILREDLNECHNHILQMKRLVTLQMERYKQYYNGERDQLFAPPPKFDSF